MARSGLRVRCAKPLTPRAARVDMVVMRLWPAPTLLIALTLVLSPAASAAQFEETPASQIVASLNAQRTAHGIPAGIVEKPAWSSGCRKHIDWMGMNGAIAHAEEPGTPGYSKSGDWAGRNGVVAGPGLEPFTSADMNPYGNAPYHLAQLLHPRLSSMGAAEYAGYDCETTFPGYRRKPPKHDTVWCYPGPGTTSEFLERAEEAPDVPGDQVGLPQGTTTGPNIIVYWDGPTAQKAPLQHLRSASLSGPDGKVPVKRVDYTGLSSSGSGFVIPVKPLRPDSEYHARVTFGSLWPRKSSYYTKHTFTKKWSFRTEPIRKGTDAVRLKVTPYDADNLFVAAKPVGWTYYGRHAALRAESPSGGQISAPNVRIGEAGGYPIPKPKPGETLHLTLDVDSFKAGDTTLPAFTITQDIPG
jgi:hypothetical protein